MASRIVDFPEPFGPMIPVRPVSKSRRVSACWRKLQSRSEFNRTASRAPFDGDVGPGGRKDAAVFRLAQIAQTEGDELLSVDVALQYTTHQLLPHYVGQRRPAPRRRAPRTARPTC